MYIYIHIYIYGVSQCVLGLQSPFVSSVMSKQKNFEKTKQLMGGSHRCSANGCAARIYGYMYSASSYLANMYI